MMLNFISREVSIVRGRNFVRSSVSVYFHKSSSLLFEEIPNVVILSETGTTIHERRRKKCPQFTSLALLSNFRTKAAGSPGDETKSTDGNLFSVGTE